MEDMEEMLKSLYCYNYGTDNRYYKNLEEKYGVQAVKEKWEEIQRDYEIEYGVYADASGSTYNSLRKRRVNDNA